ncbi:hypothetical protein GCM10025298_00900 [Natronobiforma cellulositropha]
MLGLVVASASSLALAGCGEPGEGGPDGVEDPEEEGQDPAATQDAEEEADETDGPDTEEIPEEAADEDADENGEETETDPIDADDVDADDEWAETDQIVFEAFRSAWNGVSPTVIREEENPTLELYAGREYEVVWQNEDGLDHNFEIRDGEDEQLEASDYVDEDGETVTLEFLATVEMETYVCGNHPDEMVGEIDIRADGTDDAEATD